MTQFKSWIFSVVSLFLSILGLQQASYAADELGLNVGVLMGGSYTTVAPQGNAYPGNAFQMGARVGYMYTPTLELGVSVNTSKPTFAAEALSGTINFNLTNTIITADVIHHFAESGLYIGGRIGASITAIASPAENTESTNPLILPKTQTWFAVGIVGGYDIPIIAGLSAGPRFSYIVNTARNTSQASAKLNTSVTPHIYEQKQYFNISDFQAGFAVTYSL